MGELPQQCRRPLPCFVVRQFVGTVHFKPAPCFSRGESFTAGAQVSEQPRGRLTWVHCRQFSVSTSSSDVMWVRHRDYFCALLACLAAVRSVARMMLRTKGDTVRQYMPNTQRLIRSSSVVRMS